MSPHWHEPFATAAETGLETGGLRNGEHLLVFLYQVLRRRDLSSALKWSKVLENCKFGDVNTRESRRKTNRLNGAATGIPTQVDTISGRLYTNTA